MNEDKLSNNDVLDSYVPCRRSGGGPLGDYVTNPEVGKVREDSIKEALEFLKGSVVTEFMVETTDDLITVGDSKQKEGFQKPIRSMVERALFTIVEQGGLRASLQLILDK